MGTFSENFFVLKNTPIKLTKSKQNTIVITDIFKKSEFSLKPVKCDE